MGQIQSAMTNQERDMVLRVSDGYKEALIYIYQLRNICIQAKQLNYWLILDYLLKNKLTGQKFLDYLHDQNHDSVMELAKRVRKEVHGDHLLRPIFGQHRI